MMLKFNRVGRAMKSGVVVAALALASGQAMAQHAGGDFEKPLGHVQVQGGPGSWGQGAVSMYFSQTDGDTKYELIIKDGKTTAKVNGEEIPASRVRERDGKTELLDENGKVLTSFSTGSVKVTGNARPRAMVPRVAPRGVEPPQPPEAPEPARIERPKVMLGITMSEPGESLIEHLGLKEGETVLIDRVVEDLPAAKAGLKAKDIVISFDGVKPITESQIRDILRKKEPGDKVEVKVIRKGKEETLTIELAKYESSKLEMAAPQAWRVGGDENEWNNLEIPQIDAEQMRKQMEEAMRAVRGAGGDARGFFQGPDGKVQWLDLRKGEEARKAELDARMKEFDARMKEFDATMQKFHEQIASLQATLEKMNAQKKQP